MKPQDQLQVRRVRWHTPQRRRWSQAKTTRLLWEVDRRILQQEPLHQVLGFLVQELTELIDCKFAWVGLKESDGRVSVAARLGLEEVADATSIRWDEADPDPRPAVRALLTGQVQIGRIESDGEGSWRQQALTADLRSYACFPLIVGGGSIGCLALASTHEEPPVSYVVTALQSIADQVAISVVSARAQEQIRLQQIALESSPNGVLIMDAQGQTQWVNEAFTRITGFERAESIGRAPRELLLVEQADSFWESVAATLVRGLRWQGERTSRRKDGTPYIVEKSVTAVRDEVGKIAHYVWTLQDVTDRRTGEARVQYLTLHDPLTGLPNRRTLAEYIAASAHPRALLLVGVDRLKLVNDLAGQEAGNQVLVALAQIMQGALGPAHLLTRLDEDLFGILARVDGSEAARTVAESVRAAVAAANLQPIEGGLDLTVSVGVAPLTEGEEPLRRAALALAEAKRLGRNQVVLADEVTELGQPAQVILLLQEALRGSGGFQLYLQPIERLATGETEFCEVLLRLVEPGGGLLLPGQFLEAAAQYHLMPHVDGWVVTEALCLLVGRPQLRLFVNLSGQGLNSLALLESIESAVLASGPTVAERLVFEITETSAVRDLGRARQWMTRLSSLGVRFALDDFGSGFASFEYLAALPVQFVKVSGTFVRNLDTDPRHRAMVEAVTAVAHALEKQVIAEWVESRQVAELLTAMGVEFGQGFALGRPAPVLG